MNRYDDYQGRPEELKYLAAVGLDLAYFANADNSKEEDMTQKESCGLVAENAANLHDILGFVASTGTDHTRS